MGTSSHRTVDTADRPNTAGAATLAASDAGTLDAVDPSLPSTSLTAEKPKLTDAERAERLKLLAERISDPDGLDREALAQVEQLNDDEQ